MMNLLLPTNRADLLARLLDQPIHTMPNAMPSAKIENAQEIWSVIEPRNEKRMLYLHIPFCLSRCLFCGFYQNKTCATEMDDYTGYLLKELKMMAGRPAVAGVFDTVYFGGGTPTDLSARDLGRLIRGVRETVTLSADVEFTVEGRLFGFDDEKVQACLDAGANRFSFGVQSFDTKLRKSLGRRLPKEDLIERINRIKELGGDQACVVVDLIYGLPGQTLEDWLEDVRIVQEETRLDGVDLYRLKMLPDTPFTKKFGDVPWTTEELLARQVEAGSYLENAGWNRLSVTHWGRGPLERNRYNHQAKTGIDTVPIGCGAGGSVGDYSFMQMMEVSEYRAQLDEGKKPVGMVMPNPKRPLKYLVSDQMERCFFDPNTVECACDKLIENWRAAGIWIQDESGVCALTELGKFFQPRLSVMLTAHLMQGGDGA